MLQRLGKWVMHTFIEQCNNLPSMATVSHVHYSCRGHSRVRIPLWLAVHSRSILGVCGMFWHILFSMPLRLCWSECSEWLPELLRSARGVVLSYPSRAKPHLFDNTAALSCRKKLFMLSFLLFLAAASDWLAPQSFSPPLSALVIDVSCEMQTGAQPSSHPERLWRMLFRPC